MEKYILDFFDEVLDGKYGITKLTKSNIATFVEKADNDQIEQVEDLYWDWTSVLTEPEDIDIKELENIIISALKK
jgi:hypothetical protein